MRTRQAVIAGVLALAILGLAATTAAAQEAPARAGFWGGFGMGWGSMGVGCGGCGGAERLGSYSGYLKLGGTLNPHVLLGGEFYGWSKSENGVTVDFGNASAAAYYYPDVQSACSSRAEQATPVWEPMMVARAIRKVGSVCWQGSATTFGLRKTPRLRLSSIISAAPSTVGTRTSSSSGSV